jgi:hypothetical protein
LGSGAGGSAGGASNLAFTGLDVVPLLVGGSGLIGAGLLLLGTASVRRRRLQSAS